MKQQLTNSPKIRFPEFHEQWVESKVSEFFEFKNGLNKGKEYFGKGTPIINYMDVFRNPILTKRDIKGKVFLTVSEMDNFSAKKGDVFFTRTSETINDIGLSSTLVEDIPNCVFSGFVLRARPISSTLDNRFISYLMRTSSLRKEITRKSSMTTRALTSGTILKGVNFFAPQSITEQQKIASFLSAVDKKIELLEKKKELLEQYKKGVMQRLFPRKGQTNPELRFKDENGKDFPDWEEKRLGEVLSIGNGKDYKHLSEGDIPVYGTGGILAYVNESLYEGESVGIGRKGTIDNPVFLKDKFWTVDTLFYTHSFNGVSPRLIYYLFSRINWKKYNEASGVPSLSQRTILSIEVSVPDLKEQKRIVEFLDAITSKSQLIKEQIKLTKLFKEGLLQRMFV